MADIGRIDTARGEIFTAAHVQSQARKGQGYFVISGCDVHESDIPGLSVVIDPGVIQFGWGTTPVTVAGGTLVVSTPNLTYPRLDTVYLGADGAGHIYAGTPGAVAPVDADSFKKWELPAPGASIPTGVILSIVDVEHATSEIIDENICDIAEWGPRTVEAPSSITPGKIPKWSSTPQTLDDGVTAPSGTLVGTSDGQSLSNKTFSDNITADLGIKVKQIATPSAPGAGYSLVYTKSDGNVYVRPAGGSEIILGPGNVTAPVNNTDNKVPQWNGADSKTLKDGLTVGTGANNLVQLNASAQLPAVDGSLLTGINKTIPPAANTDNKVPQWDGVNSKTLKDGLTVGTGIGNLVQLNASAQLPAVDGSLLTNINKTIPPTTHADNYVPQWNGVNSKTLKEGLAVGTGANNLVQLNASGKLPAVSGENLTGVLLSATPRYYHISFIFTGGGAVIQDNDQGSQEVPVTGTIIAARLVSTDNTSGSIAMSLYKATWANTPGSMSLVNSFVITTSTKNEYTGLSHAITVGEWLKVRVTSPPTSLKYVTLTLRIQIT